MIVRAFLGLTALALPAMVQAQAYQCRVPQTVTVPKVSQQGESRVMPVTGYTLALNWSPEFCKTRETQSRHRTQCSGRNGRFGLVVHGLWPESRANGRAGWPQYCPTPRKVTPIEARRNLCMMPSARLLAHQWAKHGSCMTRRPETYFEVTRILWNSLRIPDYDRISRRRELTVGNIRNAFVLANPGWRAEAVGVHLNERGWLEELRLCYSKRFRPTRCDSRRFGAGDSVEAKIWRGL